MVSLALWGCGGVERDMGALRGSIVALIAESGAETVGVYFRTAEGDTLLIDADVRMHAASTMKVPVMVQLFRDADAGRIRLVDSVTVVNRFESIVDGSPYALSPDADSDTAIYDRIGEQMTVLELIDRMITRSSNLATNILIDLADPRRVTATMREFGADSIEVLRGVEDIVAFRAGRSNTTTARDLGVILLEIARREAAGQGAIRTMLEILERQHFTEGIPAGLPPGTRVANKTGWITGITHDAAIVYPDDGTPYVLVVLVRGLDDHAEANELIRSISELAWRMMSAE